MLVQRCGRTWNRLVALAAGGVLSLAPLVHAATPAAAQAPVGLAAAPLPNAHVLGITESALEYCGRIDPSATVKLELQKRRLIKGLSQPTLEKIRNSDEYRQAFAAESDFVAKVNERNAKRICAQALAKSR